MTLYISIAALVFSVLTFVWTVLRTTDLHRIINKLQDLEIRRSLKEWEGTLVLGKDVVGVIKKHKPQNDRIPHMENPPPPPPRKRTTENDGDDLERIPEKPKKPAPQKLIQP